MVALEEQLLKEVSRKLFTRIIESLKLSSLSGITASRTSSKWIDAA